MPAKTPQTVTATLVDRANALLGNWPPNEFEINKLRRDSKGLRKISPADYQMILGMCATMEGDIDGIKENFEAAIKKSGGDKDPIENYAKSLVVWNYFDEACDVMRQFADRYIDNVGFLETFLNLLGYAGRFHEATIRYREAKKLGPTAEGLLEQFKHLPHCRDLVEGIDDDAIAEAVTKFSEFLRKIDAVQLPSNVSALDENDTGAGRGGVEFLYFVKETEERAAQLDFDGSLFLADAQIELVLNGIIIFGIFSDIEDADADRAA